MLEIQSDNKMTSYNIILPADIPEVKTDITCGSHYTTQKLKLGINRLNSEAVK